MLVVMTASSRKRFLGRSRSILSIMKDGTCSDCSRCQNSWSQDDSRIRNLNNGIATTIPHLWSL